MTIEFKSFPEIKKYKPLELIITQKLHGSHAIVLVYKKEDETLDIIAGSRNRWLMPNDDNYGFASFIEKNKEEFILKLGEGRHHGEWIGPGINSGEGVTDSKRLVLFNIQRPYELGLPPNTSLVPILFQESSFVGSVDEKVKEVMLDLKTNGSKLVPGFMRPEGVVVQLNGTRHKCVFNGEETQWKNPSKIKAPKDSKIKIDYSHLLQPIRLEKLLSRDEKYIREYPDSLSSVVKDYVADLIKENQITGDEDQIKRTTKDAAGAIFGFIKATINKE